MNPTILLFMDWEKIYQESGVGGSVGGGELIKLDSVWFSILLPLTAHS